MTSPRRPAARQSRCCTRRTSPRTGKDLSMADRHLIDPVRSTTPGTTSSGRAPRALPADLLRDASRRRGIMSLVSAGLWTFATLLGHLALRFTPAGDHWLRPGPADAIAGAS